MEGRLGQWFELSPPSRWRVLGLMATLPAISALLRLFGVVRTRRWLEISSRNSTPRRATIDELQDAERLARLADIAGRRGAVLATCVPQAFLLYWLLRRRGLAPTLLIGVRKEVELFDAHAWVELEGLALGQADVTHLPFPALW